MSDRGAQEIFGELFRILGKIELPKKGPDLVRRMWELSKNFDTNPSDWECDRELIKLGLAKRGIDKRYPEDGETTLYKGLDYK